MSTLQIRELLPSFGAEVSGLEPAERLDDETCAELQRLFAERELLLFRGLDADRHFQTYLCEMLRGQGQPDPAVVDHNTARHESFYISNTRDQAAAPFGELNYHSDAMWSSVPYDVLSLWAEEVEPPVIPTRYVSVTHAWDTLPADLRARVEGKSVVQTNQTQVRGDNEDRLLIAGRDERTTTTPIGHRNPRSGRTMLYVCSMMTSKVVGLPDDESEQLLEELFVHINNPAGTWQHDWSDGDLVIWDNLAVQHARDDVAADGPVRTLRKATSPETPVGVVEQTYATQR